MPIRWLRSLFAFAVLLLSISQMTKAESLNFSGTVTGVAVEDPTGRCAPFITVNATGGGNSNLLGAFQSVQSHCTTSLTTFGNGVFTLTSLADPGTSLFGSYSGTASVQGTVLAYNANLIVQGGTGIFTAASGTLLSQGALGAAGVFNVSFNGVINTAPEPATMACGALGLLLLGSYFRPRSGSHGSSGRISTGTGTPQTPASMQ